MEIKIPAPAEEIIGKLSEHGYEAYIVGGCVRDMLLGREPGDWDITTSALPEQVKQVFRRTVDTGIRHGTVTVMMDKEGYEVTTYRIDGEYADGRHPNCVEFTSSLLEDLKRRDFTINAMAYNSRAGFVDAFGGVEDLKNGVIRCVGEPMDRFHEDALRILRAIRFSAQLGFSIEERTYEAIRVIAPNMARVSKERIQVELTKLLLSDHPGHIALVYGTGISPYVSERFHEAYCCVGITQGAGNEAWDDRERAVAGRESHPAADVPWIPVSSAPAKHIRWAAFLRNCAPDQAELILKDLKLDNDTIYRVKTLITWLGCKLGPDKQSIRIAMSRMESVLFDDLLNLKMCLAKGKAGKSEGGSTPEAMPETVEELRRVRLLAGEIRKGGDCISLKTLAVRGNDIIAAGVKPGKEVGAVLAHLLDLVLEAPERNTKEYLLRHLR